jgi:patatin-like phospholipase/acyl hydrolase
VPALSLADVANVTTPAPAGSWEALLEKLLEYAAEIICPWYDNTGLRTVIQTTLGPAANKTLDGLIGRSNSSYVLLNTVQLRDSFNAWVPLVLTNLQNLPFNRSGGTLVIDAALSTSAAPVYFPPYAHPTYGYCADGGLFANNPGVTALTVLMNSGVPLEQIWMLSLSTGETQNCLPASVIDVFGAGQFGALSWLWPLSQPSQPVAKQPYTPAIPLMPLVFDVTSQNDSYECAQLLSNRFKRADVGLERPVELDDYSPNAIQTMTRSTAHYMESGTWQAITTWVAANFAS